MPPLNFSHCHSIFIESWFKKLLGKPQENQEEEIVARTMGFTYLLDRQKNDVQRVIKGGENNNLGTGKFLTPLF